MPLGTALETLLAMNYDSFILTVELLVWVSTTLTVGDIKYLILMLEKCMVTVIVKAHVYCWKYHLCINLQYFESLYRSEDIFELTGVHIANFEVDVCSNSVEYFSISNFNSCQCSCKQCCAIAVYAMCYSVINPCG